MPEVHLPRLIWAVPPLVSRQGPIQLLRPIPLVLVLWLRLTVPLRTIREFIAAAYFKKSVSGSALTFSSDRNRIHSSVGSFGRRRRRLRPNHVRYRSHQPAARRRGRPQLTYESVHSQVPCCRTYVLKLHFLVKTCLIWFCDRLLKAVKVLRS